MGQDPLRLGLALVLAAVLAGTAASCGGAPSADKSGASVKHAVTLRLEMSDQGDALGLLFADRVAKRSGGALKIQIDPTRYSNCLPAAELELAHALESGHVDLGYLPARAWAADGLPAFKALLAPFVITTQPAGQSLASGPVAGEILRTLPASLVGLALVPASPRRVLATRPPLAPADFAGLRIRIVDDPQSAADFTALGARPEQGVECHQVFTLLQKHKLDAVESEPSSILNNGYFGVAHYLSAYSPFPKFQSIVISRRAWRRLSAQQRTALQAAAADATAAAARQVPATERSDLSQLCEAHVRISEPTAAQLAQLVSLAQPALRALERDPAAARALAAIHAVPGAGPRLQAGPVPSACGPVKPAGTGASSGPATIPNGVYRVTDTVADWRKGDVTNDATAAVTFTTTLRDGRWYQVQKPNYPDQGPFTGTYSVHGSQVVFIMSKAGVHGENSVTAPETVKWSYFNGKLRFKIVEVADSGSRVIYTAHPWVKIR